MRAQIPKQVVYYTPGALEELKHGWVHIASFLFPVYLLIYMHCKVSHSYKFTYLFFFKRPSNAAPSIETRFVMFRPAVLMNF